MAVIYLGLFKMQESYFFFQVERTAAQLAKEIAYPGYEGFTDKEPLSDGKVDFSWEEPSDEQVQSYYEAYNGSLTKIYRLGAGSNTKERLAKNTRIFMQIQHITFRGNSESKYQGGE